MLGWVASQLEVQQACTAAAGTLPGDEMEAAEALSEVMPAGLPPLRLTIVLLAMTASVALG